MKLTMKPTIPSEAPIQSIFTQKIISEICCEKKIFQNYSYHLRYNKN